MRRNTEDFVIQHDSKPSFLVGGKEGNAPCTLAPCVAVCETPVRLSNRIVRPLDNLPPDLPTQTPITEYTICLRKVIFQASEISVLYNVTKKMGGSLRLQRFHQATPPGIR